MLFLTFGKYKGVPLAQVPQQYLDWALREVELLPYLRHAIEQELANRATGHHGSQARQAHQRIDLGPLIKQWFSTLANRFHPDRGGHPERMLALNVAAEELTRLLEREGMVVR